LQTARLTLRPLAIDDAPDLHDFFADTEANRYFDVPHRDLAQTEAWVADALSAPADRSAEYVLVEHGKVIGRAAIWNAPQIGYFLRRDRWGEGLMFEALEALIPSFFAELGLREILADVDPRNAASLALLARLGFRETHRARRTIRIGGIWTDSVYLRRTAPG
jgi:RimJ/RimL family protein N-acetyltransferase